MTVLNIKFFFSVQLYVQTVTGMYISPLLTHIQTNFGLFRDMFLWIVVFSTSIL